MRQRSNSRALKTPAASPVLSLCERDAVAKLADGDLLSLFSTIGAAVSERFLVKRPCLTNYSLLVEYLRATMGYRETEQFRTLYLDKRNNLIADELMGEGTVDHCHVYPREVVKRALINNACSLILTHNHPTGDCTPSRNDIAMTKALIAAFTPLGIPVHDHIIVGRDQHTSMKRLQLI